jgi:hypothetical protein
MLALHGVVHFVVIARWTGNLDNLAHMVSLDHRPFIRFVDSTVDPVACGRLSVDDAEAARHELADWLESKAGVQLLRDMRAPTTAVIDAHGRITPVTRDITPNGGTGYPHFADPPLRLADRYPAWLSSGFTRYLDMRPKYEATLARLAERHPNHYAVYVEHIHGGKRLVDIAASLGITPGNARYRQFKARAFVRHDLAEEQDAS